MIELKENLGSIIPGDTKDSGSRDGFPKYFLGVQVGVKWGYFFRKFRKTPNTPSKPQKTDNIDK